MRGKVMISKKYECRREGGMGGVEGDGAEVKRRKSCSGRKYRVNTKSFPGDVKWNAS